MNRDHSIIIIIAAMDQEKSGHLFSVPYSDSEVQQHLKKDEDFKRVKNADLRFFTSSIKMICPYFQYDVILSDSTQLEDLIGRNVRLDYVDLTVKSSDPAKYPLSRHWKSQHNEESSSAQTSSDRDQRGLKI